jgi:hypothetical protein
LATFATHEGVMSVQLHVTNPTNVGQAAVVTAPTEDEAWEQLRRLGFAPGPWHSHVVRRSEVADQPLRVKMCDEMGGAWHGLAGWHRAAHDANHQLGARCGGNPGRCGLVAAVPVG